HWFRCRLSSPFAPPPAQRQRPPTPPLPPRQVSCFESSSCSSKWLVAVGERERQRHAHGADAPCSLFDHRALPRNTRGNPPAAAWKQRAGLPGRRTSDG